MRFGLRLTLGKSATYTESKTKISAPNLGNSASYSKTKIFFACGALHIIFFFACGALHIVKSFACGALHIVPYLDIEVRVGVGVGGSILAARFCAILWFFLMDFLTQVF